MALRLPPPVAALAVALAMLVTAWSTPALALPAAVRFGGAALLFAFAGTLPVTIILNVLANC